MNSLRCFPQRENFSIRFIQKLRLDRQTRSEVDSRSILALYAGLYTESYKNLHLVFTLKEESANGDAVNPILTFFANKCNISNALVNNNVVLRFEGSSVILLILTFRDEPEAKYFSDSLRPHVNPTVEITISPAVHQVLLETRAQ